MSDNLQTILNRAKKDKKQDYFVYSMYRQEIELLSLDHKEFTQAVIKLAKILQV